MKQIINKKVEMSLEDIDGNAFAILGAFQKKAKRSAWTSEEISAVISEATSSDYDHLLMTIMNHITD